MSIMIIPGERMEDELLYSYIVRLAAINGFTHLSKFISYISGHDILAGRSYLRYDTFSYLGKLFSLLDGLNWQEFFMDATVYPLIAPLLVRKKQAAIVNTCFIQKDALRFIPNNYIMHLKTCPECRKEMISKYGFWWYRKSHNLPLVTTCERHGCRLEAYAGKHGHELECDEFQPIEGETNPDFDRFIRELSDARLDCSLEDLMPEITKVIDLKGTDAIERKLKACGLDEIYDGTIAYTRSRQLPSRSEFSWQKALILLYLCFGSARDIPAPSGNIDEIDDFFYLSQGYKVFRPFRSSLVEMEHEACSTRFLTTMQGFLDGWSCPQCQGRMSDDQLFRTIVRISGADEYRITGSFTSLKDRVEMKHIPCGQKLNPKARSVLFESLNCKCTMKVSREEAQERAKPMKLIRFTKTESKATFRCPDCGQTFTVKYRDYIRHPHCRICWDYRVPSMDTSAFKKRLNEYVGNEYIIVGECQSAKEKVTLLHRKCGKTFDVTPVDFFQGTRCPYCIDTKYMREDEFKRFVHEISLGIYEAETQPMSKDCIITDTRTGRQMKMTRIAAMQELRKVTPSDKLPLDRKGNYEFMSRLAQVKQYIDQNYSRGEVIFTEDVHDAFKWETFDRYPRQLAKEGYLKNLSVGAFCLADDDITLEEYIRQKYIERQGHRIGFIYGNELAYNLGIIDEKPPYHMIITNMESLTHGRKTKALGTVIKLKGSDYTITDSNWRILQIVNLLEGSYRFGWNVDDAVAGFMRDNNYTENDIKRYISKPHILKKLRRILEDGKRT